MSISSPQAPHWFEKTVEYAFVMRHAPCLTCAVPLDGNHERAADAIFTLENTRWLLIEFKRKASDFSNEEDKFSCYDLAKEALSTAGEHLHFFVYGVLHQDSSQLELAAVRYWQQADTVSMNALLKTQGTDDLEIFWRYLKMLVNEKKSAREGGTGSLEYSLVAAVTEDGRIQTIASLAEVLSLTLIPSNDNTLEFRM